MSYTFFFFVFLFGLAFGSFINVVVYRLHDKQPLFFDRSHCRQCKKLIRWFDNIPLLSFLFLRGRCRYCSNSIGIHYFLVELVFGVLAVWLFSLYGFSFLFFRGIVFSAFLLVIFLYDLYYFLILDSVIIPAVICALFFNLWLGMDIFNLLLGAVIGGGFFLVQYLISKGAWIGGGDIRLGALMGCILGWQLTLIALFVAYIAGALVGVFLLLFGGKTLSTKVPFGTFLSAATFFVLLYGDALLDWYITYILWS